MKLGKLILITTLISDDSQETTLNKNISHYLENINFFVVENIRTSRRYIRKILPEKNIDNIVFHSYGKNDKLDFTKELLPYFLTGNDIGIISEAGMPAIADPGSEVVKFAHKHEIQVVPIVGPSSIFLALAASGMNGQNFVFHGYLPINSKDRNTKIKQLEKSVRSLNQTQIFMETPYRNNKLFDAILKNCLLDTNLCIASNITSNNEKIITRSIEEWKCFNINIDKQPTIFLIG
jgi:16S rRNA (cytidine1402-2'-O)-methyltransferase